MKTEQEFDDELKKRFKKNDEWKVLVSSLAKTIDVKRFRADFKELIDINGFGPGHLELSDLTLIEEYCHVYPLNHLKPYQQGGNAIELYQEKGMLEWKKELKERKRDRL